MTEQNDMDAILDAALDELDDDEEEVDDEIDEPKANANSTLDGSSSKETEASTETPAPKESLNSDAPDPPKTETMAEKPAEPSSNNPSQPASAEMFQNMLRDFIETEEEGDPDALVGQFMQKVGIQVSTEKKGSSPSKSSKPKSSPSKSNKPKNDNVDETISALLEDMAKASMEGGNSSSMPDEEEMLKGMFSQFQNGGEDFNPESFNSDSMIDGMMEQLLSKDLMYEPMKQVTESFPKWLQDNEQKVSTEEYQQ
jgi:peroxin-19